MGDPVLIHSCKHQGPIQAQPLASLPSGIFPGTHCQPHHIFNGRKGKNSKSTMPEISGHLCWQYHEPSLPQLMLPLPS